MGDRRSMIMFEPLDDYSPTNDDENPPDFEEGPGDSQLPLTEVGNETHSKVDQLPNTRKDVLSFALSVFNLMNAILGSGILGLGESLKNLGIVPFFILLTSTSFLAGYTITMLLQLSEIVGLKSYEGLAKKAFGLRGKMFTSIMIVLHCMGAICSYVYIIKTELPEIIKSFIGYIPDDEVPEPIYINGDFVMLAVVFLVIIPLASLKDISYSSGFGMICMLLFTCTVIAKKFTIPCPLENEFNANSTFNNRTLSHHNLDEEEQYCSAKPVNFNSRTAYAVPTMFFSFMCHASMLPIYAELRRPTIRRMQKVAAVSISNVLALYLLSATFGYLTFFNKVKSELLLTYSLYNPDDPLIILSRVMVIICVTLSVPLLNYPARKTIIIALFPRSFYQFSWVRHILVMLVLLALSTLSVLFVPNIRDIFGIAGATSSASLLVILPSAIFYKLTGEAAKKVQKEYRIKRKIALVMAIFGTIFCAISVVMIVVDWLM